MIEPSLTWEEALWAQGFMRVAGVDEVGLGSLCGPVVAAAVIVPPHAPMIAGVRDSKTTTRAARERLALTIQRQALAVGIGAASSVEIDRVNVLTASRLAMRRALQRIAPCDHALIDGREFARVDLGRHTAIIDGDAHSYSIACASIIAKVARDRLMQRLAQRYPGYGWERNAGYGAREHLTALRQLGVTPQHRRSFAPIRALTLQPPLLDLT